MLLAELCLAGNACPALTPTQAGSSRAKEQLQNTGMGARMLSQSEGKEGARSQNHRRVGLEETTGTDSP